MKRQKTKTNALRKPSKRGAARQRIPKNPDVLTTTEIGVPFDAASCPQDGMAGTSSPMTSGTMATELERGGFEPPQKEGMASSPLPDSSDMGGVEVPSPGSTLQRLAFFLGDEEYGIDIQMVKEIIRLTNITPVPRAPSYVRGIISLRGTVLPILDLCRLLSMADSKPIKTQRILVVSLEEMLIGIVVDGVTEVVELKEEELQPPPSLMSNAAADHIIGMGRYKGRLIILLDLEKVYQSRHGLAEAHH